AKQAAEREVQLDGLRVDLDHLDEGLDRLVGLLVQQEVEALEVRAGQRARLAHDLADVDARGDPAESEEERKAEQPPVFELHGSAQKGGGGGTTGGASLSLLSCEMSR